MNRRTVLELLGTGATAPVAGCTSLSDRSQRSTSTPDDTSPRRVSIAAQDSVPDEYDVGIEATLLEPTITESRTASVRLATTNEGERRDLSVSTGGCALLNRGSQGSSPAGLWLHRSEEGTGTASQDSRWVAGNLPESPDGFGGYGCNERTYDAGEAVSTDYVILHDGRESGYLEPGQYRFEDDVSVWPPESDTGDSAAARTVTWGFSITLDYRD